MYSGGSTIYKDAKTLVGIKNACGSEEETVLTKLDC